MASALAGLFAAAFLAATVFPAQSELVFVALQSSGTAPVWALVAVASLGNTLGAFVNYGLGRAVTRFGDRRWFPASKAQMQRAERGFRRWGVWVLLLSWAPLGDVFTVIAGVLRTPVWLFALLVAVAKTGRYVVLAWLAGWLG
jgi:membrane protein YqaA with SNARE-associated domain